ncbi:MAG: DMT family transporter [Chloroflexi bacterium]|nr:DMT family transporter [Chloroflexota bacterium]
MLFLLPVLSSMAFGVNMNLARRGTLLTSPSVGVLITVLVAPPFFLLLALANGDLGRVGQLAPATWLLLAGAGILHFSVGRSFNFHAIRLIGASRAVTLSGTSPLITMVFAIAVFGERVTPGIVAGSGLIVLGAGLMARTSGNPGGVPTLADPSLVRRGFALGLVAALCWAITPLLVKGAMMQTNAPVLGSLVSYTAAALVLGSSLASAGPRHNLLNSPPRAVQWFLGAGVASSVAQLLRYWALAVIPVTIVEPLNRTTPLFTLGLGFLINRKVESFDRNTIMGVMLVVVGAVTLFL